MLKKITLDYVGPAKHMEVDFADRLTVITGDNSLGKSLLLDVAFFCCSQDWPDEAAVPWRDKLENGKITVDGSLKKNGKKSVTYRFVSKKKYWLRSKFLFNPETGESDSDFTPGIIIYERVDGGFSICDPLRRELLLLVDMWESFHLSQEEIWKGAETKSGQRYCRGLIEDWIDWQNRRPSVFAEFKKIFDLLRDAGDEFIFAEDTIRLPGGDVTDWPAIKTPYGVVAVAHISEAVKRILALAYMIVWACHEHKLAAEANGLQPQQHLIVVLDEIEAHLHPTWQRLILPALLAVSDEIEGFTVQFIVTTHSPLVLAGLEPKYDETRDKILHLKREGAEVSLETLPFRPYGTASEWLMSPVFGLEEARNLPAQTILRQARDLMRQPKSEATEQQAKALEPDLRHLIPSIDPFWTGWHFFWHGLPGQKNDSA